MTPPPPPAIFAEATRRAKRHRSSSIKGDSLFIHKIAADDIVDRLETILRRFESALICGSGAPHIIARLTPEAGLGNLVMCDEVPDIGVNIVAPPNSLPFADSAFDLVVSSMALHAINDLPGALREARRVLKPDGLFIATLPGERTLHELRWALQTAEAKVIGRVAPRVSPFVAVKDGGALLQHAGFAMPVADVAHLPVSYTDPMRLFWDLRAMGETSSLAEGPKGSLRRDVLKAALALYSTKFPAEPAGILASVDLITLTGWAPDASQPKPLKPGSAKASLANQFKVGN